MTQTRRYDLDWLRVILFGILVPYHALIGFVSYGADVYGYRNQDIAGDAAEFIIFISHTWRIPALFLISGVGTFFLMRRSGVLAFLKNRAVRILIPLVIGVVFWNAIIAYYQASVSFVVPSFPQFWWERLPDLTPLRTGHLWFLVDLLTFSILAIPVLRALLSAPDGIIARYLPFIVLLTLLWSALWLKPLGAVWVGYITWKTITYAMYYILGFWLMTTKRPIWAILAKYRFYCAAAAITTVAILGLYLLKTQTNIDAMNRMINGYWLDNDWPRFSLLTTSYSAFYALNTLLWCAAIFGFGHHHLNRPHRWLAALNRAVYPFYIFHMVVIFVGLYYLRAVSLPWFAEFLILTFGTYLVTALLYLTFEKVPFLRPLVGLS